MGELSRDAGRVDTSTIKPNFEPDFISSAWSSIEELPLKILKSKEAVRRFLRCRFGEPSDKLSEQDVSWKRKRSKIGYHLFISDSKSLVGAFQSLVSHLFLYFFPCHNISAIQNDSENSCDSSFSSCTISRYAGPHCANGSTEYPLIYWSNSQLWYHKSVV